MPLLAPQILAKSPLVFGFLKEPDCFNGVLLRPHYRVSLTVSLGLESLCACALAPRLVSSPTTLRKPEENSLKK